MDLGDITHETFSELVGQSLLAHVDAELTVELEVVEVTKAKGDDRPDEAFSVVFRGPPETFLQQRMYDLEHARLGVLPIFLVPIGKGDTGFRYEAVFTRLKPEPS